MDEGCRHFTAGLESGPKAGIGDAAYSDIVMPGLVPGIHDWRRAAVKDVDGRDKPGHDEV